MLQFDREWWFKSLYFSNTLCNCFFLLTPGNLNDLFYICLTLWSHHWDFSSLRSLSHVRLFVTPWTVAHQTSLSIINSWSYPNPSSLSWWCHPTISSSVIPFSSCPQSFPASGSFQMSQLFASGDQSIGVSASASVPPMNTQEWSSLGWTGWISLHS